nr:DNA helicase [Tanacetum cinerariifolium]
MTSLDARVDDSINIGRGPYVFKISSQLYHWLGSLCPVEGERPRFLQLYVYDTDNKVDNHMFHFGGSNSDLRRDIVEGLIELLDNHNALVQLFRTAPKKLLDLEVPPFKVRLFNVVGAREYELSTGDMLGATVYEPIPDTNMDFDIVIDQRIGQPQRVSKLHPSYMALQFSLPFVYGEDGYSKDIKMVRVSGMSSDEDRRLTMKAYYSIDFIRAHQNDIRNEYLSGIYDAIICRDSDGSDCGGRLILPQSFIGGPCYMYAHYLDALAICRVHGNPSYFITFTCNVKWPENTEYMDDFRGVTTTDRSNIVDRVFEMKIHQFMKYLRDMKPFGKVIAIVYTVEFQKRGLPHCHTLLWVDDNSRVHNYEDIDNYIPAELPSKEINPEGHMVVAEFMIHAPCSEVRPAAACIKTAPVHVENMQRVVFKERDQLESVTNNPHKKKSTLTKLLDYNNHNADKRSLADFGIPLPPEDLMLVLTNRLLMEEKSYNHDLLAIKRDKLIGNTFLWKMIIYALRTEGKIVIAIASFGIASLLLPSETYLIIWDESPMNDRRCFETLDRTLRDILDTPNKLFGGKHIMLGGDFRQTLLVKKSASRTEIIGSSIAKSYLWHFFKLFILTENVRLTQGTLTEVEKTEVSTFPEWLLNVGDGVLGVPDESVPKNTSWLEILVKFQIPNDENGLTILIEFIYDKDTLLHPNAKDL